MFPPDIAPQGANAAQQAQRIQPPGSGGAGPMAAPLPSAGDAARGDGGFQNLRDAAQAMADNFIRQDPQWNDAPRKGFFSMGSRHAAEGHLHSSLVSLNEAHAALEAALIELDVHGGGFDVEGQYIDADLGSSSTLRDTIQHQKRTASAQLREVIESSTMSEADKTRALQDIDTGQARPDLIATLNLPEEQHFMVEGRAALEARVSGTYEAFVDAGSDYSVAFANRVFSDKDGKARPVDPTFFDVAANVALGTAKNLSFSLPVLMTGGMAAGAVKIFAQGATTAGLNFLMDQAAQRVQEKAEIPSATVSMSKSRANANSGPYNAIAGETMAKTIAAIAYCAVNGAFFGSKHLAVDSFKNVAGFGMASALITSAASESARLLLHEGTKASDGADKVEDKRIQTGAKGALVTATYKGNQDRDGLPITETDKLRIGKQLAGFAGAMAGFTAAGAAYAATGAVGQGATRTSAERFGELAAPFFGYFVGMGLGQAAFESQADSRVTPMPAARSGLQTLQTALRQSGMETTMSLYNDMIPKLEARGDAEFAAVRNVLSSSGQATLAAGEADADLEQFAAALRSVIESVGDKLNSDGTVSLGSPMTEVRKHLATAEKFLQSLVSQPHVSGNDPDIDMMSQSVKVSNVRANLRLAHAWLINAGLERAQPGQIAGPDGALVENPVHGMTAKLLPIVVGLRAADREADTEKFADQFAQHLLDMDQKVSDKKTEALVDGLSPAQKAARRADMVELLGAEGKNSFDARKVADRLTGLALGSAGQRADAGARAGALAAVAQEFVTISRQARGVSGFASEPSVYTAKAQPIAQAIHIGALVKSGNGEVETPAPDTRRLEAALNGGERTQTAARVEVTTMLRDIQANGATEDQLSDGLAPLRSAANQDRLKALGPDGTILARLAKMTDYAGSSTPAEDVSSALDRFSQDAVNIHARHRDLLATTLKGSPTLQKPFGLEGSGAVHHMEEQKDIHFHIDDYNLRRGEAPAIHYLMSQNNVTAATLAGIPHAVMGASYYDKVSPQEINTVARLLGKPAKPVSYRQGDSVIGQSFKDYRAQLESAVKERKAEIGQFRQSLKEADREIPQLQSRLQQLERQAMLEGADIEAGLEGDAAPQVLRELRATRDALQDLQDFAAEMTRKVQTFEADLTAKTEALEKAPASLNLSVTGIDINNAKDMGAYMDEVMRTYPGLVKSVGEVTLFKEVVSKNSGQIPQIDSPATAKLFDSCAERGLPLVLHCDVAQAGPGGKQKHREMMMSALQKGVVNSNHTEGLRAGDQLAKQYDDLSAVPPKKLSVVWCHGGGISRYTPAANDHTQFLDKTLKDPTLKDSLKVDLSWDFIADNMMGNTVDLFKKRGLPDALINQLDAVRKTQKAFSVQAGRGNEANDGIDPDLAALHHVGAKQAAHQHKEAMVLFKELLEKEVRKDPGLADALHSLMSTHGDAGNNWLYLMNTHSDRLLYGSDTLAPTAKMHGAEAYDVNSKMLTPFYDMFDVVGESLKQRGANEEGEALKGVVSKIARENYDAFINDEALLARREAYETVGLQSIGTSEKKSHTFVPEVALHMPPQGQEAFGTDAWMRSTMSFAFGNVCRDGCC